MADVLTPDICVIGAGSGGLSVAAAAAAFGVPVVLIEKGKMGGDCLNYGCVPSKALLAAAKHAVEPRRVTPFGLTLPRAEIDFAKVNAHVHGVIAAIAPNDSKERFTGLGVHVIEGAARFTDADDRRGRRQVRDQGAALRHRDRLVAPRCRRSRASPRRRYLTNETIFELKRCPEHLIIIGAGPIGLELAQAHRRLGAKVTVLEAATPLAKDDPECAAIVLEHLAREGIVDPLRRQGDARRRTATARSRPSSKRPQGEETIEGSESSDRHRPPRRTSTASTSKRPASNTSRAASWSTGG